MASRLFVLPFVCLSVTLRYCDHRLEYFENNFTARGCGDAYSVHGDGRGWDSVSVLVQTFTVFKL